MTAAGLRIALLQLVGCGYDRDASLARGEAACRAATAAGADLALFPELWSANYAARQENGRPTVVDPIAFDAEGRSRDTRVFEAGEAEDVCVVRLDLEVLREWRRREVWGGQCRRPETYGALVEERAGLKAGSADDAA